MAQRTRTLGTLRLAKPVQGEKGTFQLIETENFTNMREVSAYLKLQQPEDPEDYLVVRLVSKATVTPEYKASIDMEPVN